MAYRTQFEGNNEIGVFCKLTNAYCIVGVSASANFYSGFEAELSEVIPVVNATIGGTRIVGRLLLGNRHGLLCPSITTDEELQHIRNSIPDEVKVERIQEKFSALGNVAAVNDYVGIVHPDLDSLTKELITDVLKIETYSTLIGSSQSLLGTYSVLNNKGGAVAAGLIADTVQLDQLSTLLQIPLVSTTVNRGSLLLGSGLVVNDWIAFCGHETTATELSVIENIYQLRTSGEQISALGGKLPNDYVPSMVDSLLQ